MELPIRELVKRAPIATVLRDLGIEWLIQEVGPAEACRLLDVPDCGCPYVLACNCPSDRPCRVPVHIAPPCEHLLAHSWPEDALPWIQWYRLIHRSAPRRLEPTLKQIDEGYLTRPLPRRPIEVLEREARVEQLAERRAQKVALWHPGDLQGHDVSVDDLGRILGATRNWRPVQERLVPMQRAREYA